MKTYRDPEGANKLVLELLMGVVFNEGEVSVPLAGVEEPWFTVPPEVATDLAGVALF